MIDAFSTVLLFTLTVAIFALCMLPAFIEWYAKTDQEPLRVVREHDTNIRHFAYSFVEQLQNFAAAEGVRLDAQATPLDLTWQDEESISFIGQRALPQLSPREIRERLVQRVIVGTHHMQLPDNMVFEREVYCHGDFASGSAVAFRALYAAGDVALGKENVVVRWLHGVGGIAIGEGSRIFGRCSADGKISLAANCEFERLNAPLIEILPAAATTQTLEREQAGEVWEPPKRSAAIDPFTVKVFGDEKIAAHTLLTKNLIVKGVLEIADGAEIRGDIKAGRALHIAANTIIRGALVCRGPITLGRACVVAGPIISETDIQVSSGCDIGEPDKPTTVSAPQVELHTGVRIYGSVWGGENGRSV